MILSHSGNSPIINESGYIAPTATICGNVKIGQNSVIMHGAAVIAEGSGIEIGDNCIVLENAVLRSTLHHRLKIGNNILIGPNAHVVGCIVEDNVFIATGASVFHGAKLRTGCEVRINGVVHIKTEIPENGVVPIGWVAVGTPAQILSPEKHEEIWAIQRTLNFNKFVYGVDWKPESAASLMPEIAKMMTGALKLHKEDDEIV